MAAPIAQDSYLNDTAQFDVARKKATDQSAVNLQARKDALARRFASLGNLDSGARLKMEENAANDEASNLNNANEGINAQQQAELGRRKEVVMGQNFQAGEAEKGRQFSGEQAAMQRQFATGERLGGQDFSAGQNDLQRKYATGEREAGQKFQGGQADLQRTFLTGERTAGETFASKEAGDQRTFLTGERTAGQTFASDEAKAQRQVQEDQFEKTHGIALTQLANQTQAMKDAQENFTKTYGLQVQASNLESQAQAANLLQNEQERSRKKGGTDKLARDWGLSNITTTKSLGSKLPKLF